MNQNYVGDKNADVFVNPYNFISLPDKCNKNVDAATNLKKPTYSGTIFCKLETLTPLFIPNTTTEKAFPFSNTTTKNNGSKKTTTGKAYDFFSYEDMSESGDYTNRYARPIIPGSSIRGAVRSAYEAVTNSCLSTCGDEDLILHRRTNEPKAQYGVLVKAGNGHVLYEAEKLRLNTQPFHPPSENPFGIEIKRTGYSIQVDGISKTTGDIVYIEPLRKAKAVLAGVKNISAANQPNSNYGPGILFLGEKFQNKHYDAVFMKRGAPQPISEEDYNRFFKVWEQYQKDKQEGSPGPYPNYITLSEIPVYYGKVGDKFYIAPACISKEVFDAKMSTLLGEHKPCTSSKEKICPACALFGLISKDSEASLASRIMFKDATPIDFDEAKPEDFYEHPRQLPILGSPRLSATEFYIKDYCKKYKIWNYDYGVKKYSKGKEHFTPKLRGRKMYWHKKTLTDYDSNDRADLTAKIRAVKPQKSFGFEIVFDRITKDELDSLAWTLTFGDNAHTQAHKLGHGKPVGYGSVRYEIDRVLTYALNYDSLKIEASEYTPDYNAGYATPPGSDYMQLTNFQNAPENIAYPEGKKGKNGGSTYQWFSTNKGSVNKPEFRQVLATPGEIMLSTKARVQKPEPVSKPQADDYDTALAKLLGRYGSKKR
ncbi:MAG: TIGR03986 family CRISPR-associated RAMP protein [Clostridiales bacterium]|jgi:CRISPR-associated protein (TIGR03986 family)|nr:TIGR03986 family CRISPR-associated RAMP protein [Clostridiales bacterium]